MEVYLIPVGRERHELYCEPSGEVDTPGDEPPPGMLGRVRQRFADLLRTAEERQRNPNVAEPAHGRLGRVQERLMTWVAERMAEQRLLWHLRRQTAATVVHPQDMSWDDAVALVRQVLQRDYDRHRRWLIVDVAALVVSGALAILPGPNLVAYYFAFRVWGHWLSMRGAVQGLHRITWSGRPCPLVAELREAAILEFPARTARIHDIAERLRLPHLATFVERLAVRPHHA